MVEITDEDGGNARWYEADQFWSDRYADADAARAAMAGQTLGVDVEVKVEQEDAKGKCGWLCGVLRWVAGA